ncbi:CBS domain-containing protein [Aureimonas frigidaquae]|uniref:Putative signal transduction protein with CBS domains n=1 Tax=Aureimonas frigidaquae TaxID=424757 RepID=A0A0P0Z313_9HYPH|nr:CBS domain-containing protein [Aureimonas frigidaquae]BAT28136.1 putative signal transduction protein with CBS domains [Aureimonas frigidaquae]
MTVKQILEQKGREVETIGPDASLSDAAAILSQKRIGALVVLGDNRRVAGILSERDIVRVVGRDGGPALSQRVAQVMTTKVVTAREDMTVDQLMDLMTRGRFRHLPVCEDERLVGVISIGDVVKRRIEDVEREADDMRAYIHTVAG